MLMMRASSVTRIAGRRRTSASAQSPHRSARFARALPQTGFCCLHQCAEPSQQTHRAMGVRAISAPFPAMDVATGVNRFCVGRAGRVMGHLLRKKAARIAAGGNCDRLLLKEDVRCSLLHLLQMHIRDDPLAAHGIACDRASPARQGQAGIDDWRLPLAPGSGSVRVANGAIPFRLTVDAMLKRFIDDEHIRLIWLFCPAPAPPGTPSSRSGGCGSSGCNGAAGAYSFSRMVAFDQG